MRISSHAVDGLSSLHLVDDPESRRALWRSSLASLASSLLDERTAAPLEGAATDVLLASVQMALADRLLDDVDFLAPEAASVALYELAAALPPCELKRELGRRTLNRLRQGDARTFVGLAAQLALSGSKRALAGASIRARVALALDLPLGSGTRADALALALISRREHSREWLTGPSTGSLPSRRLAAKLLERAAREAARRAQRGDDAGVRIFQSRSVGRALDALWADRESLVWRHVASAKGLLSAAVPELATAIERDLDPKLGVTEWRRAAAALGASIAVRGEPALQKCHELLASPVAAKDPGVLGALLLGLPRAIESDPALVEPILEHLVHRGGVEAIEALIELRRERLGPEVGRRAVARALAVLEHNRGQRDDPDEGRLALVEALLRELAVSSSDEPSTLRQAVLGALLAFAEQGASAGHAATQGVLRALEARLAALEACDLSDREGRITAFRHLHELDVALLESDTLLNLQLLGARGDEPGELLRPIGGAFERLVAWLEKTEGPSVASEPIAAGEVVLRRRRVRTLLHLVDSDGPQVEDRVEIRTARRLRIAGLLFQRVATDAGTPLHRALCATAARACDALVREEIAEVSDVAMLASTHIVQPGDLDTLAEASMVPELKEMLAALARLDACAVAAINTDLDPGPSVAALRGLANALPVAASMRIEAFRGELLRLADALEPTTWVSSLHQLSGELPDGDFGPLVASLTGFARLLRGSRRKLLDPNDVPTSLLESVRRFDTALERKVRSGTARIDEAYGQVAADAEAALPVPFARTFALCMHRAATLPVAAAPAVRDERLGLGAKEAQLPAWIPPNRTLGGFYVVRPLGTGAGGTVFVARRAEDRHDEASEAFALKVPDYSGAAARTLSEVEFMQLFREEAGALLMLPGHPNLARFVTFDAGAKPKSFLVMELVDGPNVERLVELRELSVARALELLDGVAAGLASMHAVGIGHLDVKPSNVIVRESGEASSGDGQPVLVDFGLAGRKVRPGCGTLDYAGPEVWGLFGDGPHPAPPTDVYAFCCMAFELLTGETMFDAPNERAMIAQHVSHDGRPSRLEALATDPVLEALVTVLSAGLRVTPSERASIDGIRSTLAQLAPALSERSWPLGTVALAQVG